MIRTAAHGAVDVRWEGLQRREDQHVEAAAAGREMGKAR